MDPLVESTGRDAAPRVSIVLPAYNGARTIRIALESLAAQDYPISEWVVVDDASVDGTSEIGENFLKSHDLPGTVLRHPENRGLAQTLNDGVRAATGDLVLIVHQDVSLVNTDWLGKAVARISGDPTIVVLTGLYSIHAADDVDFEKRSFGFLRRQFHRSPPRSSEFVTFTEFKCDLIRKSILDRYGGFPTRFRICGEDIVLCFLIRRDGGRIVKYYDLPTVQRFTGHAETIPGDLYKEFRFGEALGGIVLMFRTFAFRELGSSRYAKSRSLHRATQPFVAATAFVLLVLSITPGMIFAPALLGALIIVRFGYYTWRLWPDFRSSVNSPSLAAIQTLGASSLGLMSDVSYSLGLTAGVLRTAAGARL